MTDKPEKLAFEQRRIVGNLYESIPRRKSDKRLFDSLTQKQQDAFDLIEQGRNYEMTGLPQARMRYSDAPGGMNHELTPGQMQVLFDYREWRTEVYMHYRPCHYAVISYMRGMTLGQIDASLKVDSGKAARYISIGLNRFCILKRWGDQEEGLQLRRVRMTGCAAELKRFAQLDYRDELGRQVYDLRSAAEVNLELDRIADAIVPGQQEEETSL